MNASAEDLWRMIQNGRSARLDWLNEGAPLELMAAALTGMANSQGGVLLMGIGPTASLIGVRDVDGAIDRVLQAALSIDPPLIIPLPRVVRMHERPVVVVHIPPGMPHVYSFDGRFFYRQGTENAALKPRELR